MRREGKGENSRARWALLEPQPKRKTHIMPPSLHRSRVYATHTARTREKTTTPQIFPVSRTGGGPHRKRSKKGSPWSLRISIVICCAARTAPSSQGSEMSSTRFTPSVSTTRRSDMGVFPGHSKGLSAKTGTKGGSCGARARAACGQTQPSGKGSPSAGTGPCHLRG